MIDSTVIKSVWEHFSLFHEPTKGYTKLWDILCDEQEHRSGITDALEHIRLIDQKTNGVLTELGYGYCFDPALWAHAREAKYQARALELVGEWCVYHPNEGPLLTNIVVRTLFSIGYTYLPPRIIFHKGISFLMFPHAYEEAIHSIVALFLETYSQSKTSTIWDTLVAAESNKLPCPPEEAPAAFRWLVGRMLVSGRAEHDLRCRKETVDRLDALCAEQDWFSPAFKYQQYKPEPFETVITNSIIDFAIAHEVGHIFSHKNGEGTMESDADFKGFLLFATSWGWRDERLEGCPFSSPIRTILGPIWFLFTAILLLKLRECLEKKLLTLSPKHEGVYLSPALEGEMKLLEARNTALSHQVEEYLGMCIGRGASFSEEELAFIGGQEHAQQRLLSLMEDWVESIPASSLRAASA